MPDPGWPGFIHAATLSFMAAIFSSETGHLPTVFRSSFESKSG
jgi:hypothetical protein